jgi:hypothetical protein
MGQESRQGAPVGVGELLSPLRVGEDDLYHPGVQVDDRGLDQVQRQRGDPPTVGSRKPWNVLICARWSVTERITLTTAILIAPYRGNGALLAKQLATVDVLSQGRLHVGIAVGGREDDYQATGSSFRERGRAFDRKLAELRAVWAQGPPGPCRADRTGPGAGRRSAVAVRRRRGRHLPPDSRVRLRLAHGWRQSGHVRRGRGAGQAGLARGRPGRGRPSPRTRRSPTPSPVSRTRGATS